MKRIGNGPAINRRRPVNHAGRLPEADRPLKVRSFGFTDRGRVRSANEDQFLIAVLARALRVKRTSLPKRPTNSPAMAPP